MSFSRRITGALSFVLCALPSSLAPEATPAAISVHPEMLVIKDAAIAAASVRFNAVLLGI
jgi:hypothetical protein